MALNGLNVFLVDLADGIGKPEHGFLPLGKKDESCLNYLPKCQEFREEVSEATVNVLSVIEAYLIAMIQD